MSHQDQHEFIETKHKDFAHNWVSTSRFLWFAQVFLVVAFVLGGCYNLYQHRYKTPQVSAPENTLYNPKYK